MAICTIAFAGPGATSGWAQWEEIHKLTADDAAHDDLFGTVGIGDGVVIVGARADDDAGPVSGSAYLFDLETGEQLHKLTPEDGAEGDESCRAVALSSGVAIVGSERDDDACPEDPNCNSGSAYLFDVATGKQLHKLVAEDEAEDNEFGWAVAIDGVIAVVGAPQCLGQCTGTGTAYLFDVITGTQLHKLTAEDGEMGDLFGISVSISGNMVVVGAPGNDDGANSSGSAYIFDADTGQQLHKLTADDASVLDFFGARVSISGDTALVGAPFDDDKLPNTGSAYVFDVTTGEQLCKLTAEDPGSSDYFGYVLSVSAGVAMIGVWRDDEACPETPDCDSGAAYLFDVSTGEQLQKLTASDRAEGDLFGLSVAIDGGTAVIGAERNDDACPKNPECNSGSAYVFQWVGLCPADVDGNGVVNSSDLASLLDSWGPNPGHAADLNSDGIVGPFDLALLLNAWGPCP